MNVRAARSRSVCLGGLGLRASCRLAVVDNGEGIDPRNMAHVVDRFCPVALDGDLQILSTTQVAPDELSRSSARTVAALIGAFAVVMRATSTGASALATPVLTPWRPDLDGRNASVATRIVKVAVRHR